jgi:hypothetical protein
MICPGKADVRPEQHEMRQLAGADALRNLAGHRRQQVWQASALRRPPRLLHDAVVDEDFLELPAALEGEEVVHDYETVGLSLRSHSREFAGALSLVDRFRWYSGPTRLSNVSGGFREQRLLSSESPRSAASLQLTVAATHRTPTTGRWSVPPLALHEVGRAGPLQT